MNISTTHNMFSHIRSVYGSEVLTFVNNRIYMSKLVVNWSNHRVFNLRCIQSNLMPRALRVRSPDSSERSKRAARVAERTFLRQRVYNCSVRLLQIRRDIQQLDGHL
ncbi:hypothetical protein EG68_11711 [Paragonimus skrjabini miyazakii]|uniref:Uncharacterized protein n=1 Tax=Paragonimus skrjabini miyazakii TaxID=59628 RepID=A0A8S9YE68_9TREM|nr:hypothetical protein EG68_11711 [Paragonimus skrjabini miyazakii]